MKISVWRRALDLLLLITHVVGTLEPETLFQLVKSFGFKQNT